MAEAERAPIDEPERRRAPRVLVDLAVDYRAEDTYLFADAADISVTGIFLRTTTPEAPGTLLHLRFEPDGDDADGDLARDARVTAHGDVVRDVAPGRARAARRTAAARRVGLRGAHGARAGAARGDDVVAGAARDSAAALDARPLHLEGEVMWVNPYRPGARDNLHPGMGVRFVGLDAAASARLLGLIRKLAYLS